MQRLKEKLHLLGIRQADIAKRAGQRPANMRAYFSEASSLGPGPTWVEDAIRGVLLDAGVPAEEVNELVGSWKQTRLLLSKGAEVMSDKQQTLEQQIGALVKSAWTLSLDVEADKAALKGTVTRGLGIDAETRRRAIEKRLDDELATETAQELQAALWERRRQELADRIAAARQERSDVDARATALEAAIAGRGDEKLLEECQRLGVNPQDRLNALRNSGVRAAQQALDKAIEEERVFANQPLHPVPPVGRPIPVELVFANDVDRAALVLAKPWTVAEEQPELALHIFSLRRAIVKVHDMANHLREGMGTKMHPSGTTYRFFAGFRKDEQGNTRPVIGWSGRTPPQRYSTAQQEPSGILFIGDPTKPPALERAG